MVYFVLLLFIGLIIALFVYSSIKIRKFGTDRISENNYDVLLQKLDKSKWRGGVRFPAGYYKTKEEFYQIEKNLKYHR